MTLRTRIERLEERVNPRKVVRFLPPEIGGEETCEGGTREYSGRMFVTAVVVKSEIRSDEEQDEQERTSTDSGCDSSVT